MKLNLGCGMNHEQGYVNVDCFPEGKPDVVWNLEVTPWPWEDNSVDEILMRHSLEHMGASSEVFLNIIKEIYRICKPNAKLSIQVPHPRHDNYLNDPTHVRPITPELFYLFSKKLNHEWKQSRAANSPLALYLDVDFEVTESTIILDPIYGKLYNEGGLSQAELTVAMRERNNIVAEYDITLRVLK